ncbi:MAG: tRNA (uridine(34)/cytosine(34)/5-carboxymethylaminomethyluridine(34)-2'-O)-methyltransferase TrmL [Oscillospiraceae bacterium]|nr:tRNA (uridine(34)/cytosine(34)/5-carboxymethylaminomethyluridine(34)-2'-O)-methyltransferase TrmL [Oscillospiraceae bacterium]
MFNIVLVEPEIPANTGNISRTCAVTGAALHLVRPLGFDISDREVRRAGLDYWKHLDISVYDNIDEFFEKNAGGRFFFCTTKAKNVYTDMKYQKGDYFIFGKETKGLPEELLREHPDECIRIPMLPTLRSLNLSNSVAVVAYEALRQVGFENMQMTGQLHNIKWE